MSSILHSMSPIVTSTKFILLVIQSVTLTKVALYECVQNNGRNMSFPTNGSVKFILTRSKRNKNW